MPAELTPAGLQAAVVVALDSGTADQAEWQLEPGGIWSRLPNLDLPATVALCIEQSGGPVGLGNSGARFQGSQLYEAWTSLGRLAGVLAVPGEQGAFLSRGIESLTLRWPASSLGRDAQRTRQVLNVLESAIRALSNAEERLHHATTLYWPGSNGRVIDMGILYAAAAFALAALGLGLRPGLAASAPAAPGASGAQAWTHVASLLVCAISFAGHLGVRAWLEIIFSLLALGCWLGLPFSIGSRGVVSPSSDTEPPADTPPAFNSFAVGLLVATPFFLANPALSCVLALGHVACALMPAWLCILVPASVVALSGATSPFVGAHLAAVCLSRWFS